MHKDINRKFMKRYLQLKILNFMFNHISYNIETFSSEKLTFEENINMKKLSRTSGLGAKLVVLGKSSYTFEK